MPTTVSDQSDHLDYGAIDSARLLDELEKGDGPFTKDVSGDNVMLPGDTEGSTKVLVSLDKKSLQDLRELCRGFNLKSTGTKPVLVDRLREFSSQPELWKARLNPGARRSHLGPQKTVASRKTSTKASMQRRDGMFGSANPVKAGSVQPQLPTARIDMRTAQQKANFLIWARRNVERHTAEEATELMVQQQVTHPSLSLLLHPPSVPASVLPQALPPLVTPPPPPLVVTSTQLLSQSGTGLLGSLGAAPVAPSLQALEDRDHALQLGSGVVLHFRTSEIPDGSPVPILSKDLSRLGKIWDDTHSSWDPTLAPLVIRGHPIALKYWQAVYRRDPKGRWNNIKKYWHNWKMIAERWHKSTPENFWTEFTDENGKQKSYTQILERLREQHKQDCLAIAATAQEEYGDTFFSKFSYHKRGKRVAMTDPMAVSRHYKRCKAD